MKRFVQMLLLMLLFAAFTVAVHSGPTKTKCEHHYAFIQAQPDNMLLASNTPICSPEKGYLNFYRQGDVEKSSYSNLCLSCSYSQLYLEKGLCPGYMKLTEKISANKLDRRYRLDIGENIQRLPEYKI
jgi:hypothetical protein